MKKDYLNFVIIGHVDHGKSTFIGRLLFDTNSISKAKINDVKEICKALNKPFEFAFLMDYLTEEREQNITIDTAQTFFKTDKREYLIIDAPGHKEFLKNMITGATLAEAAILIVDGDEGIMEQTKRHAYMLSLLGIKQLIVVINKMDKINYSQKKYDEITNDILEHLNKVNLKPNYIIPISAKDGDNIAKTSVNINWYDGPTVLKALDSFTNQIHKDHPLRLPIQDRYDDILVGQIESGTLAKNQEILVLPGNLKTKITSLKKWKQDLNSASIGENIGLTLEDSQGVKRGNVICDIKNPTKSANKFKATIFWMIDEILKPGESFNLKLTTQETSAKITSITKVIDSSTLKTLDKKEIGETEVAEVEIETEKEIVMEDFNTLPELGRFVIIKNEDIAGGGIIN